MLFTSFTYYLFLGAVLALYYTVPWRISRWLLVAASYVFYGAAEPWYCLLLLASTMVDYIAALRIHRSEDPGVRKRYLLLSVLLNLGLLCLFKYADFGIANLNGLLAMFGIGPYPLLEWLLPVGISFYTFQTMSYTIDVYRGKLAPTRDFGAFALYVAFFPQLVAGPIERAHHLLPQFLRKPAVTRRDLEEGFQRILWGLMKKNVFADRFGLMVDHVYASPAEFSAPELIIATMCFSFQLYLDFSAYTDIAIGTGRLMGVRLSENFNYPFLARNPSDFWSRWHMTLTSWFRDYVFASLGGMQRSRPYHSALAVVLTMSLVGLWHGAAWNYVAFGFLSGVTIVVHQSLRLYLPRRRHGPLFGTYWWSPLLAVVAANVTINIIMVFFRSPDLATAWTVIAGMVTGPWRWSTAFNLQLGMLVVVWVFHLHRGLVRADRVVVALPPPLRGALWMGLVLLLLYGSVDHTERFIYFQF